MQSEYERRRRQLEAVEKAINALNIAHGEEEGGSEHTAHSLRTSADMQESITRAKTACEGTSLYPSEEHAELRAEIDMWVSKAANALGDTSEGIVGETQAAFLDELDAKLQKSTYVASTSTASLADVLISSDVAAMKMGDEEISKRGAIKRWMSACKDAAWLDGGVKAVPLGSAKSTTVAVPGNPPSKKKVGRSGKRKESGLGLSVTRDEDFGQWYSELVVRSELIEYYDVSGCYILRPWAYQIWEQIQSFMDKRIKGMGVENCYFPLFVSEAKLQAEKDHVEGFAPEVAWVTRSGEQDLENPIAVRPTSETVMYPIFKNWVRSHRDLPLRLNQWCNVVRWEFKHPTPFIRSREFLWQEGHTAFATKEEADEEVLEVLDMYRAVYEDLLAVPVVRGVKSEREKFAGGLYTTTVEAFVPSTGRGVQGGTSHCLGQSFAKMFEIEFEAEDKTQRRVWQNSWGMTTRTIGVMIMVHADDRGLVLPPRVAPTQVVVVPIPFGKDATALVGRVKEAAARLGAAGVRVKADCRENYTPGWKYNHWELKGVPLRAEVGPRDFEEESITLVRRDTGEKCSVPMKDGFEERVAALLKTIQNDMLARARAERNSRIATVMEWKDFMPALDRKMMVLTPWKESVRLEEEVKKRSQEESTGGAAKTLCIPFEQPPMPEGCKCFVSGEPATKWVLWGRSY